MVAKCSTGNVQTKPTHFKDGNFQQPESLQFNSRNLTTIGNHDPVVRGWEKHSTTLTDQHLVWPCAYFGKTVLQLTEWLGSDKYDEISSNNYKRVAGAEILTNNISNVKQIIICAMLQENIVGASVGSPNWGDPATNKSPLTGSHHEIHRYRRLSS